MGSPYYYIPRHTLVGSTSHLFELYLFRTLIILIPASFFTANQHLFTQYIWNKKAPECAFHIMTRHRSNGALGVPNTLLYYKQTVLAQLCYWCNPDLNKLWLLMEASLFKDKNPKMTLLAISLGPIFLKQKTQLLQSHTKSGLRVLTSIT